MKRIIQTAVPLALFATPAGAQDAHVHEVGIVPGDTVAHTPSDLPDIPSNAKLAEKADFAYFWKAGEEPPASVRGPIEQAIEHAHKILSDTLWTAGPPIEVCYSWEDFEAVGEQASRAGLGGPETWRVGTDPITNETVFLPAATHNHIVEADEITGPEISIRLNSNLRMQVGPGDWFEPDWYFPIDASPAIDEIDLVTVLLHELLHGLGFVSTYSHNWTTGVGSVWSTPTIWDSHVFNATALRPFEEEANNSTELGTFLIASEHYLDGHFTDYRSPPRTRLEGPNDPADGFRYTDLSHFHADDFGDLDPDSVMTPATKAGVAMHQLGPAIWGGLEDIGWGLNPAVGFEDEVHLSFIDSSQDHGFLLPGQSAAFNAWFWDVEPYNPGATLRYRGVLKHAGGEYEFEGGIAYGSFQITIPNTLPDLEWRRDGHGNIAGFVSLQQYEGSQAYNLETEQIYIPYAANTPIADIENPTGDSLTVGFYSAGATRYDVFCVDVSANGPCQSNVQFPVAVTNAYSLDVSGLDPNHQYEFYVSATNSRGQSGFALATARGESVAVDGVALWLPFDQITSGVSPDMKGYGDATAIGGGASLVSGIDESALSLTNESYFEVPHDSAHDFGRNDFSASVWVKTSYDDGYQTLMWKRDTTSYNGFVFMLDYYGKPYFFMSRGHNYVYGFGDAPVNDGQWHLLTVSVDRDLANGGIIYVDGEQSGTFDSSRVQDSIGTEDTLYLGRRHPTYGGLSLSGEMDELMLFSRALSAEDAQQLHAARNNGFDKAGFDAREQVLGHWTFDNGDSHDISGNGLHATLTNASVVDGKLVLDDGYGTLLHPERLQPPEEGFSSFSMEAVVSFATPDQYYNIVFSHPDYSMAAHSLYYSQARSSFRMRGLRSTMGMPGGRWGTGPNLWSDSDAHGQAYYWGWEMNAPSFMAANETHHIRYEYNGSAVNLYVDDVLEREFTLGTNNGVTAGATSGPAYIGRNATWNDWFLSGEIDELKLVGRK